MNILNDEWEKAGSSLENFESILKELEENTEVLKVPSKNIQVLSNLTDEIYYKIKSTLEECNFDIPKIRLKGLLNVAKDVELDKNTHTLFYIENEGYFFLSNNLTTLGNRTGIGDAMNRPSLERDLHVHRILNKSNGNVNLVVRKQGKVRKIEAVMSGNYAYISQDIIPACIKGIESDLGLVSGSRWVINNHSTKFYGFFNDKKQEVASTYGKNEFTPGVFIMTSDTGDAAFRINECWKKDGKYIIMPDGLARKHFGEVNVQGIVTGMEKIWGDFKRIPDRMMSMMATPVTTKTDETEAREELGEFLEKLFESVKFEKKFGKKFTKKLITTLQIQTDYETDSMYELYDNIVACQDEIIPSKQEDYQKMMGILLLSNKWA